MAALLFNSLIIYDDMTYTIRTTFLLAILALAATACQKDDAPQVDTAAPVINIVAPSDGHSITPGSALRVVVDVQENQALHEYNVVIRNADRSYARTLAEGHLHATAFTIEADWTVPEMPGDTFTITVKASDHNGNQGMAKVAVFTE